MAGVGRVNLSGPASPSAPAPAGPPRSPVDWVWCRKHAQREKATMREMLQVRRQVRRWAGAFSRGPAVALCVFVLNLALNLVKSMLSYAKLC